MRVVLVLVFLLIIAPLSSASVSSEVMEIEDEDSFLGALNGSGVVIAVADTGIDLDHSCFRNSTSEVGVPGDSHRKVILLNDTIDDWDNQGDQQFKHGTHIAGILACDSVDGNDDLRSMSSGAKLIVQDIVDSTGWSPPDNVASLLAEASANGAVINSWSWGDNSINYTDRSKTIDEWTVENPWSLVFIAPGNSGGMMLEPSNAYNVVSVTASDSNENGSVWPSSSHGPDVNGRRGTLVSAPGVDVVSAKADGLVDSMNNGTYAMTGTSMATPMAASFTAVLQQMVEEKEGYTPSAPLLRALLASSAEPLTGGNPDYIQGYGRPNLDSFSDGVFVHDSYAVEDWQEIISSRGGDLDSLKSNPWNGSGAAGPFLSENESWSVFFQPVAGEDVEVVMSYNARPMGQEIDDIRLIVKTSDGRFAVDDQLSSSGFSTFWYESVKNPLELNSSNETTVMIRIPEDRLVGVEWIEIEVVANTIVSDSENGNLGINGSKIGFGIAATGVADLIENEGPIIVINDGPGGGDNFTDSVSINLTIEDLEGDGVVTAIRLVNLNFSIDIGDCALVSQNITVLSCNVNFSKDLIPRPINRHDWFFEIVAVDDNSSFWTSPEISFVTTENFTIWWESPMLDEGGGSPTNQDGSKTEQNRVLLWGVVGIVFGAIVAASIMFRGFEKRTLDVVLPPFREEE